MPAPHEALSAAVESWNAGDLDGYLRLYDEGIRLYGYSPEPMDKAQVRGFYEGIFSAFGTPKLRFEEILWDGDACTIRFTMTGRSHSSARVTLNGSPGSSGPCHRGPDVRAQPFRYGATTAARRRRPFLRGRSPCRSRSADARSVRRESGGAW